MTPHLRILPAADALVDRVLELAAQIAGMPHWGRTRPEWRAGIRSFLLEPYILYYRPKADVIELLRVIHGAREVRTLKQN